MAEAAPVEEAADDADAGLDVELAAVLELEEEQAARASADAPASPAIRRGLSGS